ncbi:MAG: DUF4143 domain-containing protein [Bifidobacteriaceae bacterium]|jgi:predicted AAA+ superfamily ATPase|nr:DUF4143 domain-containing protein [Bifidobacteriaceae bacterium]
MTLREPGYRDRLADSALARLLSVMGAVSVEGPKWCGKTWTSLSRGESVYFVADPTGNFRNRELAALDPASALAGAAPHVIDEWQEIPALWDAVRFAVDRTQERGRFILTGSSAPRKDQTSHSGTGRVARLRMRPMSLFESGEADGRAGLARLLEGQEIAAAAGQLTLAEVAGLVVRGGWPGAVSLNARDAQLVAGAYVDELVDSDISAVDGVRRDPVKVRALVDSLARNAATTATMESLRRDMAEAGETVAESTLRDYLTALGRLYVLESIPAWTPALRSPIRLRQAPKRMLVDPSLAAVALGADVAGLKAEPKTLGLLFESLVLRDLLVYAQALGAQVRHYRDNAGLEVDAIIVMPGGQWIGIEIKLGFTQVDKAAQSLLRLKRKMADGGHPEPTALAVVVGVGSFARRRDDGVEVVPVDLFGP